MKNWINIILLGLIFSWSTMSFASEVATKEDIRTVLEQMDKRFEQMEKRFEQMDKRFEQMDKRFEQMDKRFEQSEERMAFMQSILYIILAAALGTPFMAEYFARRREAELQQEHDKLNKILFALKNMARDDPKVKESLQMVDL